MPSRSTERLSSSRWRIALAVGATFVASMGAEAQQLDRTDRTTTRAPASRVRTVEIPSASRSAVPEDDSCQPVVVTAKSPKLAFLNYFWHRPEEFQCTMLVPQEGPISSNDYGIGGYYHKRFERLKSYGVDVLGFVLTGVNQPDYDIDGNVTGTWRHGRNLENATWLAEEVGLPFFVYYDLNVRTAIKQKVCKTPAPADRYTCPNPEHRPISEYDLRRANLYHQIRKDLLRIKDDLILPHLDSYYMLEDERGNLVLDEAGLPRPVVGIYIARDLVANNRIERLVANITKRYRQDGLGQPAFVLDTIFWNDPLHARVVRRFGTSAVAVTSFFPVNQVTADLNGVQRMLDWVPLLHDLYGEAAAAIAARKEVGSVQVWPGISSMFDNRKVRTAKCAGFRSPLTPQMKWHLHGREDWRALLRTAYDSAYRVGAHCSDRSPETSPPIQSLVINYENEFRESAITDCVRKTKDGRIAYPFHFACELMGVVAEEDRWR